MQADPILQTLFDGLSEELRRWAMISDDLQDLAGRMVEAQSAAPEIVVGVQQLDSLGQHLDQLAALCARLALAAAGNDGVLDGDGVRTAIEASTLSGLIARVRSGAGAVSGPPGECELW